MVTRRALPPSLDLSRGSRPRPAGGGTDRTAGGLPGPHRDRDPLRQRPDAAPACARGLAATRRQRAAPLRHGHRLDRHRGVERALPAGPRRRRGRAGPAHLQQQRPRAARHLLDDRRRHPERPRAAGRHRARAGAARRPRHLPRPRPQLRAQRSSARRGLHGHRLRPPCRARHRADRATQSVRGAERARLRRAGKQRAAGLHRHPRRGLSRHDARARAYRSLS